MTVPDLGSIQATILKGHGRNFGAHAFLRRPAGFGRAHLDRLVAALGVTSAAAQQEAADRWRRDPTVRTPPVHVVGLSARGLRALGYGEDALPGAGAFWAGMAARADALADPVLGGGAALDADVVVLLADDSERVLEADLGRITEALPDVTVGVEWGQTIRRRAATTTYEPFGFADGISDPEWEPLDTRTAPRRGVWWSPAFPFHQVLVHWEEPGLEGHGSFLVFRKLRQDVERFHRVMTERARAAGTSAAVEAARAVGRRRDGTPLVDVAAGTRNDLSFAADLDGARCPVSAHIRAVNPRLTAERGRQVARRGMPYRSIADDGDTGLLFLAYMADIEQQFEWMQRRANEAGDAIAGQGAAAAVLATLLDGQYFFVPPIRFLVTQDV